MLTLKIETCKNYERHYDIAEMNKETLKQVKSAFNDYRAKGVILNEKFSDDAWILTNQLKRITINFCPNEFKFKRYAEKWVGCSYQCYIDGIKTYAVLQMGNIALAGIKENVRKIIYAAENPRTSMKAESHLVEFLKLLPDNEIKDQVIEELEEKCIFHTQKNVEKRQRVLAEFDYYFQFDDAIEKYWETANKEEKLFYLTKR